MSAKRLVDGVELLRGNDLEGLPRDGGRLDALAGVQERHVVHCGGEDCAQDEPDLLDARRADVFCLQVGHPLADVSRHDLIHPHGTEPREDVLADLVGIRLPRGHLHHVIRQPFLCDVTAECLPPAARVAQAAFGDLQLGALPRLVGLAFLGEGSGALYLAADVAIAGTEALDAILGLPLLGPAHRSHPKIAWQQNGSEPIRYSSSEPDSHRHQNMACDQQFSRNRRSLWISI